MKKATYYLSAMLMVACFTQPVSAQFEGEITYSSYEYGTDGTEEKEDEFSLFITSERILLQGENKYEFMGSIKTEGVLVRLDFKDFVFLTGNEQALKISKSDITSMMNMFDNGKDAEEVAEEAGDVKYERLGEKKSIKGYECEKFIFRDGNKKNQHTIVWMTKDVTVNWGMLAEPWSGSANDIISNFPMDLIFVDNYFPLQVEGYKENRLVSKLEATDISTSAVAKAMVNVPSGVKVLSFQDYLFQQMSKQ